MTVGRKKTAIEQLMSRQGVLHRMPPGKLAQLKGEILDIFSASDKHRGLTIPEFAASILPPVHFDQFRVYRDAKRVPIGWVSWAWMTAEEGEAFMRGDFAFDIPVWIGGEQLWFIDFIAPFGHAQKIIHDLRTNVFPNEVGFAPDIDREDGERRVRKFIGANVKGADQREDNDDFLRRL